MIRRFLIAMSDIAVDAENIVAVSVVGTEVNLHLKTPLGFRVGLSDSTALTVLRAGTTDMNLRALLLRDSILNWLCEQGERQNDRQFSVENWLRECRAMKGTK